MTDVWQDAIAEVERTRNMSPDQAALHLCEWSAFGPVARHEALIFALAAALSVARARLASEART